MDKYTYELCLIIEQMRWRSMRHVVYVHMTGWGREREMKARRKVSHQETLFQVKFHALHASAGGGRLSGNRKSPDEKGQAVSSGVDWNQDQKAANNNSPWHSHQYFPMSQPDKQNYLQKQVLERLIDSLLANTDFLLASIISFAGRKHRWPRVQRSYGFHLPDKSSQPQRSSTEKTLFLGFKSSSAPLITAW